jgi:hypothetical protein
MRVTMAILLLVASGLCVRLAARTCPVVPVLTLDVSEPTPLPDAGPPDTLVLDGELVEVAAGVKLRVPPGATAVHSDHESLFVTMNDDVTLAVIVRPAGPHAPPIDNILKLAKEERLDVISYVTDGPNKATAELEGSSSGRHRREVLHVVATPRSRIIVALRVFGHGGPAVDQLLNDVIYGPRLVIP